MSDRNSYPRLRIQHACSQCQMRKGGPKKVKCDGQKPCNHCIRHQRVQLCQFEPQRKRRTAKRSRCLDSTTVNSGFTSDVVEAPVTPIDLSSQSETSRDPPAPTPGTTSGADVTVSSAPASPSDAIRATTTSLSAPLDTSNEEEAEVPRDARLLCDAQGKLIFIGDCAPLSFFQTVRQLVTTRVEPSAFAPQTDRGSMLENVHAGQPVLANHEEPQVNSDLVGLAVENYLTATTGFLDLFDDSRLKDDISLWVTQRQKLRDVDSAVYYLVLAIGLQSVDDALAVAYFEYAKNLSLQVLGGDLSVGTVQAFALVTFYMIRACQITGAFLFFGIAARSVYSIGAHRTEVNSRFGPDMQKQRDRLWLSIRAIDLFLSISMGRPPATSDVDCTVNYHTVGDYDCEPCDLLHASIQILMVIEGTVLEVYSRKKISLALTEGISRQLREWSRQWLALLKRITGPETDQESKRRVFGACQVLSTYYYAVMLVSRPFLMYEMYKRLPDAPGSFHVTGHGSTPGRSKLANACIDAAGLMIEMVQDLIHAGLMSERMPILVSWLFPAALVAGVGLLGGFGRILDKYSRMSIAVLEHFAKDDAHALQYSIIAKALHLSAISFLERKEVYDRLQITESSSQIFGLMPRTSGHHLHLHPQYAQHEDISTALPSSLKKSEDDRGDTIHPSSTNLAPYSYSTNAEVERTLPLDQQYNFLEPSVFDDIDPALFAFDEHTPRTSETPLPNGVFGALNLFPLLDEAGHIDLTHQP